MTDVIDLIKLTLALSDPIQFPQFDKTQKTILAKYAGWFFYFFPFELSKAI
jgi:hypothetical protein